MSEALARQERATIRTRSENAQLRSRLIAAGIVAGGGLLAGLTTLGTGFLEMRVRTKDGAPLSLGPISLPAFVAMLTGTAGAGLALGGYEIAAGLTGAVANGHVGMASGTVGRGLGTSRYMAKAGQADKPKAGELASGYETDDELQQMLEHAMR